MPPARPRIAPGTIHAILGLSTCTSPQRRRYSDLIALYQISSNDGGYEDITNFSDFVSLVTALRLELNNLAPSDNKPHVNSKLEAFFGRSTSSTILGSTDFTNANSSHSNRPCRLLDPS